MRIFSPSHFTPTPRSRRTHLPPNPAGIGDNLLLQPNAVPCERLWGFAKSEEAVIVTFLGREYRSVAARADMGVRGGEGRWSVCLDTVCSGSWE